MVYIRLGQHSFNPRRCLLYPWWSISILGWGCDRHPKKERSVGHHLKFASGDSMRKKLLLVIPDTFTSKVKNNIGNSRILKNKQKIRNFRKL